jgi:hypothetical protein
LPDAKRLVESVRNGTPVTPVSLNLKTFHRWLGLPGPPMEEPDEILI